jgi:hypothetical protein
MLTTLRQLRFVIIEMNYENMQISDKENVRCQSVELFITGLSKGFAYQITAVLLVRHAHC